MEPLDSDVYEALVDATPTVKYYFLYNERTNDDRRNETDLCINRERDQHNTICVADSCTQA